MKKLIYALVGLLLLVVIAIGVLFLVVDPNQFKPLITDQVKKATGRELVINGDIGWTVWPSIGLSLENVALKNPSGFAEPDLLKFESAQASVSVMPLLSKELEVGMVSLEGAHVFIQTKADGKSNLDGLTGDKAAEDTASKPEGSDEQASQEKTAKTSNWSIAIKGVELLDASAVVRNDKAGSLLKVNNADLTIGEVAIGRWVPVKFAVDGTQNQMTFSASGETELNLNKDIMASALRGLSLKAAMKDGETVLESADLSADKLALGDWGNLTFAAKGQIPGLAFDASGKLQANLNKAQTLAEIKGLSLKTDLKGEGLPRPEMTVSFDGDASYNLENGLAKMSSFAASVDELKVTGNGSFQAKDVPVIRFALNSDNIDVDAFLGTGKASEEKAKEEPVGDKPSGEADGSAAKALSDKEPDLSALKGLDLAGTVKVGNFKAANATMSDVDIDIAINRGVLTLKNFGANLYQGAIKANATIDARKPVATYKVFSKVTGVQVQPLLKDVVGTDMLAGNGNIGMDVSGTGLSQKALRSAMTGKAGIKFADGAVYGVNLPEMIREAKATLKGKRAEYVEEARKTDFSELTATFNIGKGIASTNNLELFAPALRVHSEGQTNLLSETLDFEVATSVVGSSKGQGGQDVDELKDLTIPVKIGGTWQKPTYKLDVKALLTSNKVLEEKARKEAERGLKKLLGDKVKDDKVKEAADQLLKGLFN